jgi:5'-deoxynucleotidase YfbR-like HD superfamily hydrolase
MSAAVAALPPAVLRTALYLAQLGFAFGRVDRITFHEDGATPESDTDHTIMLALIAVELAPRHLDRGLVALYALVHDLVEVYSGDTQTLKITAEIRADKQRREADALTRLVHELGPGSPLGGGSPLGTLLEAYEKQVAPEARFVRLLDKVMPKLTHLLNGCAAAKKLVTFEEFELAHEEQHAALTAEYPEFPETLALLREAMTASQEAW